MRPLWQIYELPLPHVAASAVILRCGDQIAVM
jgi:hypothetical protein